MAAKKKVAKKKTAAKKRALRTATARAAREWGAPAGLVPASTVIDLAAVVTAVQIAERARGPIEPRRGPRREVRNDG
jgi:hypothetical protein